MVGLIWLLVISVPVAIAIGVSAGWRRGINVSARRCEDLAELASGNASRLAQMRNSRDQVDRELGEIADELDSTRGERDAAAAELTRLEERHQEAIAELDNLETELGLVRARNEELEADLSAAATRLGELEATIFAATVGAVDMEVPVLQPPSGTVAVTDIDMSRQQGLSTRGGAGADQQDDLQAIIGIGPRMEELLNTFGIRSYEQLAALSAADAANVDQALDLRGRMKRDEWVNQARALVRTDT